MVKIIDSHDNREFFWQTSYGKWELKDSIWGNG